MVTPQWFWLKDSNLRNGIQSPASYHWTKPEYSWYELGDSNSYMRFGGPQCYQLHQTRMVGLAGVGPATNSLKDHYATVASQTREFINGADGRSCISITRFKRPVDCYYRTSAYLRGWWPLTSLAAILISKVQHRLPASIAGLVLLVECPVLETGCPKDRIYSAGR